MSLPPVLLVAIGGALGASARYGVGQMALRGQWLGHSSGLATMIVNLVGCLLIGLVLGAPSATTEEAFSPSARALLVTGLLGGFTTFSAFGFEIYALLRTQPGLAVLQIGMQVVVGVALVALGVHLRTWFS